MQPPTKQEIGTMLVAVGVAGYRMDDTKAKFDKDKSKENIKEHLEALTDLRDKMIEVKPYTNVLISFEFGRKIKAVQHEIDIYSKTLEGMI